jgi:hypothetical protein
MIRYTLDPDNPKKLTASDLRRLEEMTDADIDYSDIPELDDDFFKNAEIANRPPAKAE